MEPESAHFIEEAEAASPQSRAGSGARSLPGAEGEGGKSAVSWRGSRGSSSVEEMDLSTTGEISCVSADEEPPTVRTTSPGRGFHVSFAADFATRTESNETDQTDGSSCIAADHRSMGRTMPQGRTSPIPQSPPQEIEGVLSGTGNRGGHRKGQKSMSNASPRAFNVTPVVTLARSASERRCSEPTAHHSQRSQGALSLDSVVPQQPQPEGGEQSRSRGSSTASSNGSSRRKSFFFSRTADASTFASTMSARGPADAWGAGRGVIPGLAMTTDSVRSPQLAVASEPSRVSTRMLAPLLIRRGSAELGKTLWAGGLMTSRKKDKTIEIGVNRFNQKPSAGIDYLVNSGVLSRTPEDVARFIRSKAGELSKKRIGEYVGHYEAFGQEVLRLLLSEYDFSGMSLDHALRALIMDIRLPGESQQIDRILQNFARRYFECNQRSGVFETEDTVYILSFSLIMLNTDLHNRSLDRKKKMKLEEFIRNNRGINKGKDLPRELLEELYYDVKTHEMRMKEGDMYESEVLTFMAPRMSGWLEKKSEGAFGTWKRHWFVLTGGCLYYFTAPRDKDPRCIIPLDSVTAAKGSSPTKVVLYSNYGTVIKSVKIIEGKMEQGDHHRFHLKAATTEERDEWLEAIQQESAVPSELQKMKSNVGSSTGRSPRASGPLTGSSTSRSPRLTSGSVSEFTTNAPIAEGWMRRRLDVNRTWVLRYYVLMANEGKRRSDKKTAGLYVFTTQTMAERFLKLNMSTEQGMIPLQDVKALRLKTPSDEITYRPPDAHATVIEIDYHHGDRDKTMTELMSPEDEATLHYWVNALRMVIVSALTPTNSR